MILGKALAACVELCCTIDTFEPVQEMLDEALVELMKDVGSDGAINVRIW